MISDDPVLETIGLGKRFGKRWAVQDLSLIVRRGEVFGFLGPNGAGKSTTIRMVLSLIKPTRGDVRLFGRPLHAARRAVLSRVGGLVERADFYLYLSARTNLEIVASLKGGISHEHIDEVLDIVGLRDRAAEKVKTYSHGMKQRLGIAQALLGFPEFIVLDEPTSGLDPQGIREVRELIKRLAAEHGITIFLSSHLLHEVEQTATSMAIINAGQLVVQGTVRELLEGGESLVRIEAEPVERAAAIVAAQIPGARPRWEGSTINVTMEHKNIPALIRALVKAGVDVRAIVPRRSLEEYFLEITEGASEVVPPSAHRGTMDPFPDGRR